MQQQRQLKTETYKKNKCKLIKYVLLIILKRKLLKKKKISELITCCNNKSKTREKRENNVSQKSTPIDKEITDSKI